MNALILGATGATGTPCLSSLLSQSYFAAVYSLGRRHPSLQTPSSKLSTTNVVFDKLLESPPDAAEVAKFKEVGADSVIITLGTTKKSAGSLGAFFKIDREYVIAGAKAARIEGKSQRLVYCSSHRPSLNSYFPYLKSKALTEVGLSNLGYSETIFVRPAAIFTPEGRPDTRTAEAIAQKVTGAVSAVLPKAWALGINVNVLAKAISNASVLGVEGLKERSIGSYEKLGGGGGEVYVVSNADAAKLGEVAL